MASRDRRRRVQRDASEQTHAVVQLPPDLGRSRLARRRKPDSVPSRTNVSSSSSLASSRKRSTLRSVATLLNGTSTRSMNSMKPSSTNGNPNTSRPAMP